MRTFDGDAAERAVSAALAVLAGGKYASVCPELVSRIAIAESRKGRSGAALEKAVRSRLHQVCGAFVRKGSAFSGIGDITVSGRTSGMESFKAGCAKQMKDHSSTRERLPFLDEFYGAVFECAGGVPGTILDLACGLNPLSIPWMRGAASEGYLAVDARSDVADAVGDFFCRAAVNGRALAADVCGGPPPFGADLALLLKALPGLERVDKTAPERVLRSLKARSVAVSFPSRSLCGKPGRLGGNESRFMELARSMGVRPEVLRFCNETVFVWKNR